MSSPDSLLHVKDLSVGYAAPVASGISFDLATGEVLGVRGQNGAGKSTLLRAIAGGARIFSGSVTRNPKVELLHHRQQWEAGLEFPLTGRDICELTGADPDAAPQRVRDLLSRRLDQLSGGQGQLVRLWAGLGGTASLLLLDEPTNSLDTSAIDTLIDMIRSSAEKRGIIVVSHESDFLDAVCSRSITLE